MKTLFLLLSVCGAFAGSTEPFKLIHVNDLSELRRNKNTKLAVYDVNTDETRKSDGIIPGAHLLSSSANYDTRKELPADKNTKLVFYCANMKCMASHHAAERAVKVGFNDVSVMTDGIQGWVKAGQPVEKK